MDLGRTATVDEVAHGWVRVRRGKVVLAEGERSDAVYRIKTGCVRLQVNGADGDRQIVAFLFPGDAFGFAPDKSPVSIETASEALLDRYSIQAATDLVRSDTAAFEQFLNAYGEIYGRLAHHIAKVSHMTASERVLWFLNDLSLRLGADKETGPIELPMCHRDVGDFLGLTPETLSRTFRALEDDGHLIRNGRSAFSLRPGVDNCTRTGGRRSARDGVARRNRNQTMEAAVSLAS